MSAPVPEACRTTIERLRDQPTETMLAVGYAAFARAMRQVERAPSIAIRIAAEDAAAPAILKAMLDAALAHPTALENGA